MKITINGKQATVLNDEGQEVISVCGKRCFIHADFESMENAVILIEKIKHIQGLLRDEEGAVENETPDEHGLIIDKYYGGSGLGYLQYKGQGMFYHLDREEYLLLSKDLHSKLKLL